MDKNTDLAMFLYWVCGVLQGAWLMLAWLIWRTE